MSSVCRAALNCLIAAKLEKRALLSLTLGTHAQRGLWYLCVSVCLCVCVSVTQHLTLNVIIHATNDSIIFPAADEGQKF